MDYLVNGFWAAFALLANMDDATFSAITATLVSTSYAMAASLPPCSCASVMANSA